MFIIIDFKFENLLVDYKFHYKSQWKKKDLNKLKIELKSTHSHKMHLFEKNKRTY